MFHSTKITRELTELYNNIIFFLHNIDYLHLDDANKYKLLLKIDRFGESIIHGEVYISNVCDRFNINYKSNIAEEQIILGSTTSFKMLFLTLKACKAHLQLVYNQLMNKIQ
jgi:hypothetical protein